MKFFDKTNRGNAGRRKVQKADNPDELMALMGQIKALADQVQQMAGMEEPMMVTEGMYSDDDMRKQEDNDERMMEPDDMMPDEEKRAMMKEAEATASDDAEERVEDGQPDESDEALMDIEKQLRTLTRGFNQMAGVMKSLMTQINESKAIAKSAAQGMEGLLEAIGMTADVMKAAEGSTVEVQKGTGGTQDAITYQNTDIIDRLESVVKEAKGQTVEKAAALPSGREGLGQVMLGLTGGGA